MTFTAGPSRPMRQRFSPTKRGSRLDESAPPRRKRQTSRRTAWSRRTSRRRRAERRSGRPSSQLAAQKAAAAIRCRLRRHRIMPSSACNEEHGPRSAKSRHRRQRRAVNISGEPHTSSAPTRQLTTLAVSHSASSDASRDFGNVCTSQTTRLHPQQTALHRIHPHVAGRSALTTESTPIRSRVSGLENCYLRSFAALLLPAALGV